MHSQGIQQTQRQTQGVVLTPQLRQALRILQVGTAELSQEIAEEIAANPLLEEISPDEELSANADEIDAGDAQDSGDDETDFSQNEKTAGDDSDFSESDELQIDDNDFSSLKKMQDDWREDYREESRTQNASEDDEERRRHLFDSATGGGESLQESLLAQTRLASPARGVFSAIEILVGNLDERGFMPEILGNLALSSGLSLSDFEEAWRLLKTFEPAGIGAGDLRECLLIQLFQTNRRHTLAALILDECFPLLLKRRIPEIARLLDTTPEAVREALGVIATLNTAPARRFENDENRVIVPDVTVRRDAAGDAWEIILNDENLPRLRINHAYKNLLAGDTLKTGDRAYITEKMRAGKFLIGAIEQRRKMLERVTESLLRHQADFFEHGIAKLHPLTMLTLAAEIGVHETTISRAVANKFLKTPHGIFELRYFFTSGVTTAAGESVANTSIKEMLADIVAGEDPAKPLSDETLVAALAGKGIKVARRTVAKYREALKIPPAHLRKRH